MDSKVKNGFFHPQEEEQDTRLKGLYRCLRAVNDNTGEYYDVFLSSGTSTDVRNAIADWSHVLAGEKLDYHDCIPFRWTRVMLYSRNRDGNIDHMSDLMFYYGHYFVEYYETAGINKDSRGWIEKELSTLRPMGSEINEEYLKKISFNMYDQQ